MPLTLLPPVEVLAVAHLRASVDVSALVGTRIGTELYDGLTSAVWLSHVTGEEKFRNHLAAQMVDVRSYGGTKAQAELLARTVHAVMHAMPGSHAQGVVTAVSCTALPFWMPDEGFTPARPRYIGSYQIVLHPNPS